MFDPTISLGTIVAIVTFVVTMVTLHSSNVRRFEEMRTKVDIIFEWWKKHTEELAAAATRDWKEKG